MLILIPFNFNGSEASFTILSLENFSAFSLSFASTPVTLKGLPSTSNESSPLAIALALSAPKAFPSFFSPLPVQALSILVKNAFFSSSLISAIPFPALSNALRKNVSYSLSSLIMDLIVSLMFFISFNSFVLGVADTSLISLPNVFCTLALSEECTFDNIILYAFCFNSNGCSLNHSKVFSFFFIAVLLCPPSSI